MIRFGGGIGDFGALTVIGVSIVVFMVRVLPGDALVATFGRKGYTKLSEAERADYMAGRSTTPGARRAARSAVIPCRALKLRRFTAGCRTGKYKHLVKVPRGRRDKFGIAQRVPHRATGPPSQILSFHKMTERHQRADAVTDDLDDNKHRR